MNLVITGGTGSLGQAILKHQDLLKAYNITRIRIVSRDEQKQEKLEREYCGQIELQCLIGDVSHKDRMKFALKDAHYVIHAAAQKIVPKFELDIPTGFRTNINGTQNVRDGFLDSPNAKSGIFVSTDKAVDPINAYGVSKLAAEHAWFWGRSFQKTVSLGVCRYGNVFGSRGSVIEVWHKAMLNNQPLLFTDSDMTRFFISLSAAAEFVLKSLFHNQSTLMIPKMKATDMITLATVMSGVQGKMLKTKVIGIRPGEKIHECLTSVNYHEPISSETAPRFTLEELKRMYNEWWQSLEQTAPWVDVTQQSLNT